MNRPYQRSCGVERISKFVATLQRLGFDGGVSGNTINPEFVERYQILYQQEPNSRVFAPLAEAYRRMGMLEEALELCVQGVQKHPSFPGGRFALARILMDRSDFEKAAEQLKIVAELSPENIMAHQLLADCLVQVKRPKDALRSFKMVLFLNPNDDKARKMVARLESLTADEYEDDVFQMQNITTGPNVLDGEAPAIVLGSHSGQKSSSLVLDRLGPVGKPKDTISIQRALERYLSLADAFVARNDPDKALETLHSTEDKLGSHPEIERRKKFLAARARSVQDLGDAIDRAKSEGLLRRKKKMDYMNKLLERIEARRRS